MPSSKFHMNEVRIDRSALDSIPVLVAGGLRLSSRHFLALRRKICSRFGLPVASYHGDLAVVVESDFCPKGYWDFLNGEGLRDFTQASATLGRQSFGMRQRLLSNILARSGTCSGIIEGGLLQFYEYNCDSVFHDSLSITMLEEPNQYRLFLEPGYNVLYPLESVHTNLVPDTSSNLRCFEVPSDSPCREGFLGFLVGVEDGHTLGQQEFVLSDLEGTATQLFARLRRTRNSKTTYLAPSQSVRVRPSYELLAQCGHLSELRDMTLLKPSERIDSLMAWYHKLFPGGYLLAGAHLTAEVELCFDLVEPVPYDGETRQKDAAIFYPDNPLRFGPTQPTNIVLSDPYKGLRTYGPWDLTLEARPFDSVSPYIIYPQDADLRTRIHRLFTFFEKGGYDGDVKAQRYDRSFRGFWREFKMPFVMPSAEDAVPNCSTEEQYLAAADAIINKWSSGDGNPSRIAIVVFPFDQEDNMEEMSYSERLYPKLKQKFIQAGLPSQMIDRSTLEYIGISGSQLSFRTPYFGHILWNLALNIYVKLGGRPWTLQRELDNVNCLIGMSFTVNTLRPERPMYVGVANVFDEFGEWVDIVPTQRQLDDAELRAWYDSSYRFYNLEVTSSKLSSDLTADIVKQSVESYKSRRGTYPLNLVVHKTGQIYQVEMEGVLRGLRDAGVPLTRARVGFLSLTQHHNFRMYGKAAEDHRDHLVVRRGVMCRLDMDRALLATTGRTDTSSHTLGTPQPLVARVDRPSSTTLASVGLDDLDQYSCAQLCEQLMALTQLHWGSMHKEIRLPVTILYSGQVSSLSARAEITTLPKGRAHRPWFI